jgi:hypothetical protein
LVAAKAFVRNIIIMKTITFFIIVFHINCLKCFSLVNMKRYYSSNIFTKLIRPLFLPD